jgi:SPX domain protein involved in polyphosphate accumulation
MASIKTLPPVLERHELKYLIPMSYVEPITHFLRPYCQLDYFSERSVDTYYVVNSLYFDTRGLEFLQQRLYGKDGRFNIRVRSYTQAGDPPYFMEIKHKTGVAVKKYRAIAQANEWPDILVDPNYRIDDAEMAVERGNKELFLRLAISYAIEPKIFTQYRRRAFFSTVDEYARVGIDIDLSYRKQEDYNMVPDSTMINYDNETIYAGNQFSEGCVVLELKSNIGEVPMWMLDLISTFELKQEGFSKYLNSTMVAYYDNGNHYMFDDYQSADFNYF